MTPGATQITVELRAGGADLIRVVDNGAGIPADEAPLAFHRHATSKLADAAQLDCVATMGFRGEALPSIAAVSRVSLQTRPPDETAGFRMTLLWGEPQEWGSEGCAPGTALEVAQLFGNQPARRKFLRSAQAETGRAQEVVSHYALAYPEIRFRLTSDGRALLTTPGNGQPREALQAVYGAPAAAGMLEIHAQDPRNRLRRRGLRRRPQRQPRQPHLYDVFRQPPLDPKPPAGLRRRGSLHRAAAGETLSNGGNQRNNALRRG